ncbi:MAG: helix-turn-helix domain-containing protein [Gammaproteobacteria bacterium]|nr:helix-turn-helix domain-containing protein [Gammaproteobacteria bacterium]
MKTETLNLEMAAQGFAAAGAPARLLVLRVLVRAGIDGLAINEIQQRAQIPASTLAHHLKSLAAGGLIEQEKQGRTVINRANYPHIEALAHFLTHECCADSGSNKCS